MEGSLAKDLFYGEPPGAFSRGHIIARAPEMTGDQEDPGVGYWHCDIADHDRLTWSDKVYDMFGLPHGDPVHRDWAVERYREPSKSALEKVRNFALGRKFGFILDAEISPHGAGSRWIRVLAVPIVENNRVVGLHGLKRVL
jgi:PAS domain-containing protein